MVICAFSLRDGVKLEPGGNDCLSVGDVGCNDSSRTLSVLRRKRPDPRHDQSLLKVVAR